MIIGETPAITLKLPATLGIDLNDAEEITMTFRNNGKNPVDHNMTDTGATTIVVVDALTARTHMQRGESMALKPSQIEIEWEIKLPESLYPEFVGGFYTIGQFTEPVVKRIGS